MQVILYIFIEIKCFYYYYSLFIIKELVYKKIIFFYILYISNVTFYF